MRKIFNEKLVGFYTLLRYHGLMMRKGTRGSGAAHNLGAIRTGRRCPFSAWWTPETGEPVQVRVLEGSQMPFNAGRPAVWLPANVLEPLPAFIEAGPESW
jgi:hypothetical protein